MEDLVPAPARASTFQLILEYLSAILLLVSKGLGYIPALPAFLCVILAGTLVVVSLELKRRPTSRNVKPEGKKCPAHDEVSAGWSEDTGRMTEAEDAPEPPEAEASPLRLQTLCLKALNRHLSRMLSLDDLADVVRALRKSQPPKRSHVTDEKPTSTASGTDGEQLQKNMTDDLNKDTRYLASPELCQGDTMGQKRDIQEKEEEKQRLQQAKASVEQVLRGRVRPSVSTAGDPLQTSPRPKVLRGRLARVTMQAEPQREAENGDTFVHGSEDGLKGVPRDADLDASLPPADEEDQGGARELWEQKQFNKALAGDLANLRTEKASLQHVNSDLNAEIEQLKLKLQTVPGTYEDRLTQLQKQLFEAERRCLEMERKLLDGWRNMNSTCWMLNNYKKMTQDMNRDLQRSTFHYEREIRYHQGRAEAAQTAAEHMEGKLQELQRENEHHRQLLAKAKSTFQPFPGGPCAPTAPPADHRGPEVPARPPGRKILKKDGGRTHEPEAGANPGVLGSLGSRQKHKLPDLPYDYGALEPHINAQVMELHHTKHHAAYVNNLNVTEEKYLDALQKGDVTTQISLQSALKFNGGGHINHSIFWTNLSPHGGGEPTGELLEAIIRDFGSFAKFKEKLTAVSAGVQGSGWGWLGFNKERGRLQIAACPNQDPLQGTTGLVPLLGIDVWEHAYYLQYKNVRPDYLKAIWNVINWQNVTERYAACRK